MKPEWVAPIVARLRDKDSLQTYGCLYDGVGMCCLGHITEVVRQEKFGLMKWKDSLFDRKSFNDEAMTLPSIIKNEIRFKHNLGEIKIQTQDNHESLILSSLNDSGQFTLSQIADLIEYFWKEL